MRAYAWVLLAVLALVALPFVMLRLAWGLLKFAILAAFVLMVAGALAYRRRRGSARAIARR